MGIAVARVGHAEVEGVGPERVAAKRGSDGGIVNEELICHHFKLGIAADAKIGSADADDGVVGDVRKSLDDESRSGHFGEPIVVSSLCPVISIALIADGEDGDLVALSVKLLDGRVIGVLVGHEESSLHLTPVGVLGVLREDVLVEVDVVYVDGAREGDGDHLGSVCRFQIARDLRSVS